MPDGWAGMTDVTNNEALQRYELVVDGVTAIAEYRIAGERIIFHHTLVPPVLEGRGVGRKLVMAALDDAEARGLDVVPQCWFVAKVVEARERRR